MRYLFTLLFAFLFVQLGYAQVPGYMGKRAWVSVDFNFAPALFNMNQNHMATTEIISEEGRAKGVNPLAINYRPQLNFEYLVGRDVALGLSYSHVRTGTVKEIESISQEVDGMYYDMLKGNSFGLQLKKFQFHKSASIAPIGYYWTLGLAATKFNTYASKESKVGQFSKDVLNPVITLGIGKQKILFDRLIINSGMEFGWSFLPKDLVEEYNGDTISPHPHDISIHHAYSSLFGYYLFNLKLSCGYLAF